MCDMFSMKGKVAVVTGGARGLGYDMAAALCEAGATVCITSRRLDSAVASAAVLRRDFCVEVLAEELDVQEFEQITSLSARVIAWGRQVDVLINNAGGGLGLMPTDFFARMPEHMTELIQTNLTSVLYCCQVFGRIMAAQGFGSIINIASIAGVVGRGREMYRETGLAEQPVDYAAAKAGVIGMTKDLAAYLSPLGVRVNSISPGGFERGQPDAFVRAYSSATALRRMGLDGVDLKGAALFLASAASAYVTGHDLVVDGGFVTCK